MDGFEGIRGDHQVQRVRQLFPGLLFRVQLFKGHGRRAAVFPLPDGHVLREGKHGRRDGAVGGIADPQDIVPFFQHLRGGCRVEGGAVPQVKAQLQRFFGARGQQGGLGEGRQHLIFPVKLSRRAGEVQLYDLLPRAAAAVADGNGNADQ